ncbi:uncharacterized protein MYCFIDRAFT_217057 [Pseudocercospora fijiensis CIRAD86]|uniref:Peroxidase n=1 Tax=Pseudocercospora fijiensis (strain CIRAD86) TaxID=383855 RepID=M2YHV1_PSEFD|nr:uncharacterized protein MYCFIDRAFT_217057 [Pseudocercospora fijiensis CIRAD86]EME77360.1 hypothetical protein MYCFIDRAFT_217057 [Pseudocercospora fijiensis CIRAD86]
MMALRSLTFGVAALLLAHNLCTAATVSSIGNSKPLDPRSPASTLTASQSSCPLVWSVVAEDLKRSFSGCNDLARSAIRFAFHDAAGYSVKNPVIAPASGGADGSLLLNDGEISRGDNAPMKQNYRDPFLLPKYLTYKSQGVSAADLVQFAGSVGIKSCRGGPTVKTVVGRKESSAASPGGLLPQAFGKGSDYNTLIKLWKDKTFSPRELAALMGAHTVSVSLTEQANGIPFGGAQDSDPTVWDNHYYSQTQSRTRGVYSFASDVNLSNATTECGKAFTAFANDQATWTSEFAAAMYKLSVLGIPQSRTCLRAIHNTTPARPRVIRHINYSIRSGRSTKSFSNLFHNARRTFRPPPAPVKGGTLLLAALSPAAFVSIAEDDEDNNDGKTHEEHMLEISRREIEEYVPETLRNSKKVRVGLWKFLDTWIYEPIATTFRFFHLVIIFVPVIATVPVMWFGARQKDKDGERSGTLWWYGFLVSSMERAGAAFIKLGQWAASRTDIFPTQMCRIMSALHSNAPAHSLQVTQETIERAFGRRFEDIFDEFDEQPLGVGAIAQVYKAKLKPDLVGEGQQEIEVAPKNIRERALRTVDPLLKSTPNRVPSTYVAIKVLHPKIERIVRRDLCIMGAFANIINAIPTMEWFSFPDEVKQFGEMMRLQLDLRIEAANLTLFRKNFRTRSTAWFPYPYTQYTTRQVLVEEFATGIPLEHFLHNGGGVFQKEIADEGLDAFLHMLLIDNFIHADLHPGNVMVRFYRPATVRDRTPFPSWTGKGKPDVEGSEDVTEQVISRLKPHRDNKESWLATLKQIDKENYRPQLIFIDAGLVTELNETNRKNFLDLFKSVAEFDGYKSGKLMVERCRQPDAVIDEEVFALRMQHLVLGVKSRTFALGNIKIGDILNEVLDMVRSHHVRLEGDFVNVVLSILLLEGIGRTLDPDLDLFSGALPILRQLGAQSGKSMLTSGDLSMVKVWAGLEARKFLQASIESVEKCVKYDQLSPNI